MLASSKFAKLFPPPQTMLMPHAGLDISDDAIRCLAYSGYGRNRHISLYDAIPLPAGLMQGGDCKNEKELVAKLADLAHRNKLSYVKVSIPEEKAYLFQTDVPDLNTAAIVQNIESKLEENVPLAAADAMFYFDLLPVSSASGTAKASVTVVPHSYIDHYMTLLDAAGLIPVAFEIVPKAISRAIVPEGVIDTKLVVHIMDSKTGLYIVSGNIVCFASTVAIGGASATDQNRAEAIEALSKEISKVCSYWASHGAERTIREAIFVGCDPESFRGACHSVDSETSIVCQTADVWTNAFDIERRLPPVSQQEALLYAAPAGLAFELAAEI